MGHIGAIYVVRAVLQDYFDDGSGKFSSTSRLRREARDLKEVVAEQALELRLLK